MDKWPPNLPSTNHNQEGTLPEVWFKGQTTQSTFLGFKTCAQIHTPSSLRVKPRLSDLPHVDAEKAEETKARTLFWASKPKTRKKTVRRKNKQTNNNNPKKR